MVEFSAQLRELAGDYSDQRIAFDDYRAKRKDILDKIDSSMNGINFFGKSEEVSDDEYIL